MKKLIFHLALFAGIASTATAQTSMTPNNGNRGQSLPVIISGQGTSWSSQGTGLIMLAQGSYTISSGMSSAADIRNVSVVNPGTITADVSIPSNAPLGLYDLYLYAGTSTIQYQAFTVNPTNPDNITTTPEGGKPGETLSVSVSVSNATFRTNGQGVHSAWINIGKELISISHIQTVDAETFTGSFTIPAAATQGAWDVNVYSENDIMYHSAAAFEVDETFSLTDLAADFEFGVFPNPSLDEVHIEYNPEIRGDISFGIYSITGQQVLQNIRGEARTGKVSMDVSSLPKGTYVIQMLMDGKLMKTQKWSKG